MTDKHRDTNNSCGLTALVVTIISGRGVNEMTPVNATYEGSPGTSLEQKVGQSYLLTTRKVEQLNWLNINSPVKEFESPSVWVKRYKRFHTQRGGDASLRTHTHQCQPFFSTAPCARILNTTDIGAQCTTKALLCTNHIQHFLPLPPPPQPRLMHWLEVGWQGEG